MRHAPAGGRPPNGSDRDRPLTPAGLRTGALLSGRLKADAIMAQLILCSPARRTKETLDCLLADFGPSVRVEIADWLYLADARTLLAQLREISEDRESVLIVGHNPGIEELARWLSPGHGRALDAGFPPAGLAIFEITGTWQGLSRAKARLSSFLTP
jgi:phosphohistidine phosphatase